MKPEGNLEFRPLETPRVVFDSLTAGPVLLLGHWVSPLGYEVQAAIASMVMPRPLTDIKLYPAPASSPAAKEEAP